MCVRVCECAQSVGVCVRVFECAPVYVCVCSVRVCECAHVRVREGVYA